MGYAEAMAKIGMRMTKTNLARAEANPKVTITTPKAEPKADDGAAAAPRPTAPCAKFHLKKEMMDFAEDQYALAETHGDQRGKAQRLSVRLQGSEHLAVGGAKSPARPARPSWDELRVATHVVRIWHYVVSDDATFHNARVPPLPVHCYKTASPNVLTLGNDDDGQLGSLNRIYPKLDDATRSSSPTSYKGVIGIAAGASFSAAWTESGHTYVWGEATAGQLGHAKSTTRPTLPSAHGVYPVTGLVNRGGQDGLRFAVGALFDFVGAAGLYALRVTSSQLRATYDSELLGYVETLLWDRKEWARRGRASPGTGDASPASPASPVKGAAAPPQRPAAAAEGHVPREARMMGNARFLDMMQRTGNNRTTYRPRLSLGPKPARARGGGPPRRQRKSRARRRPKPAAAAAARGGAARDADGLAGDGGAAFDAAAGAFVAPVGAAAASPRCRRRARAAAERPRRAREAPAPRDPDLYAGAAVTARPLYAVDASVLRRPEAPAARAADEVHAAKLRLVVAKKKAADARRHGRDVLDVSPYVAGPPGKGHAGNPGSSGPSPFKPTN
ncbi:hypothetical protein SO694_00019176 [Aureococcus anophagefferens]|uniref:Uncharacterized protein n=1 Tax=Aureococcus anophagefferens TaxID=44056 RepID=A0ABR1FZX6_AURAN